MGPAVLKAYLLCNLLLAASLAFLFLFGKALDLASLRCPPRRMLRWCQCLVLCSVVTPFFFPLLPGRNLPEPRFPVLFSAPEGRLTGADFAVPKKSQRSSIVLTFPGIAANAMQRTGVESDRTLLALLGLWLGGFLILAVHLAREFGRLRELIRRSVVIRSQGRVRIAISAALAVPISVWFPGRRWVVVPEPMLSHTPADFRIAVKHELQHHRQGDTLWAMFAVCLGWIFYPNPAVALWRRWISELQEFSCDEALVGQPGVSLREYGSCLLRVAEAALDHRNAYVGTTGMAAILNPPYLKSFLQRRIEMLLNRKRARAPLWLTLGMGTFGVMVTLSLAYGAERAARLALQDAPNPGKPVVDERIQRIAERILADAVAKEEAKEGFAIVADPRTGRILAVANVDVAGKKKGFWSLAERIEPASIAKTFVVAEAIEQGKTSPAENHFCENGHYQFGDKIFHDWKSPGGFGYLTTTATVAMSSDICTLKIAERVGLEGIYNLLEKFGFGPEGTAKNFPGSRTGQLPPRDGPLGKYFVPFVAYGQGFRSSPIELVQAYGAIANGGELLQPNSGAERKVLRRVMAPETAAKVRGILREVVLSGTGKRNAGSYLYTTAGKTASSFSPDDDWLEESRGTRKSNLAGFIGFAPVNDPRVEVYVAIKDPRVSVTQGSGAHGAEHAAPVFRQIAEAVLQQMNVPPDNL